MSTYVPRDPEASAHICFCGREFQYGKHGIRSSVASLALAEHFRRDHPESWARIAPEMLRLRESLRSRPQDG